MEKEAKKQTAFGGFLSGKTALGASSAEKALNKKYKFDGEAMSVAEFVERHANDDTLALSTSEVNKYKGASRSAWNRMSEAEQKADEERVKNSGTKTVYMVNGYDLGKTAYEYAQHLIEKGERRKQEGEKSLAGVVEGKIYKNNLAGGNAVAVVRGKSDGKVLVAYASDVEDAQNGLFMGEQVVSDSDMAQMLERGEFAELKQETAGQSVNERIAQAEGETNVAPTDGQSGASLRNNLADFKEGDIVRDYYDKQLYRIKKHSKNGVSTIAMLDEDGNEAGTKQMNAHNNSRYSLAEPPVKAEAPTISQESEQVGEQVGEQDSSRDGVAANGTKGSTRAKNETKSDSVGKQEKSKKSGRGSRMLGDYYDQEFEDGLGNGHDVVREEPKTKGTIFDFTSKDKQRPALQGVFHNDGYAIATDSFVMVGRKDKYDAALDGKTINKKGEPITYEENGVVKDVKYPNWKIAVPQTTEPTGIDIDDLASVIEGIRIADGVKQDSQLIYPISIKTADGKIISMPQGHLRRFLRGAKQVGATEVSLFVSERGSAILKAEGSKGFAIVIGNTGVLGTANSFYDAYTKDAATQVGERPLKEESRKQEGEIVRGGEKDGTDTTTKSGGRDGVAADGTKEQGKAKVEDVGEVIAGARKDALKVIASAFENATIQSLIELPFAKAFKKPDLKKAVESGALREEDAAFYEAWFSTMVNTAKPKLSRRVRESHVRSWAEDVYKSLQVLKEFVEADVATRDRIVAEMMANKFPTEAEELAKIEQRKEWNKGSNVTWGDKTTPNRLWVAHEVLKRLGYKTGDKIDIPYGVLQANATGTGYDFYNNKGQRLVMNAVPTVEEGIERIVYLTKLKRGDTDVKHPVSSFTFVPTKTDYAESGRYRVVYGSAYNPSTKEFDSLSDAEAFAKNRKDAFVSPIKEVSRQYAYKVKFVHPLTGEKMFADEKEFDTRCEAEQYLQEQYDAVNEHVNDELAKARGEKRALSADDVVEVVAAYRGGKIEYVVSVHRKYANNMGMPLPLRTFATRADAVKYASEIKEDVFKAVQQSIEDRKSFAFFATGEDTRIGEDYRQGKDVTAEEFMDAFGFRGVQFGNWTNQRDRQMAVNQAYDALHDLAKLLGVSPKALSLNGELGIAFGSRGSGNANAHYELDEVVINPTKTRGAGSLAHEWWHALDNYFARKAEVPHGMVTDSRKLAMRDELRMAFNALLEQVDKSKYLQRSKARGDYWGRMHEVTARLLAEWVDQSLKAKGEVNTFLSRGADVEKYKEMNYKLYKRATEVAGETPMPYEEFAELDAALDGMPYPTAEEVSEFGAALRRIFDVIQERETEDGKVALFNIADEALMAERGSEAFARATEHTIDALKAAGVEVVEATDAMVEEVLGAEFVEMQTIQVANERFNHELDDFSKKQHKGLLHLGRPMSVLTAAGVNARELTLSPKVLNRKLEQHSLTTEDLKGLAKAIQSPILVYKHGEKAPNIVVVTELNVNGGKLSIALELDANGDVVDVNNVSSVHSKEAATELVRLGKMGKDGLQDGLRWVEKEKVQDWLSVADLDSPIHTNNPELVDVAKVLQDFENPKISPEFHRVYHGSGAKFDKFDHSYMGSGEGAQAFGWGTYVTEVEGIGRAYARNHPKSSGLERSRLEFEISRLKQSIPYFRGEALEEAKKELAEYEKQLAELSDGKYLYTIEIPKDNGANYLNWARGERNDGAVERIAEGLQREGFELVPNANHTTLERDGKRVVLNAHASGADLYAELSEGLGSDKAASEFLNRIGYVGIKYPTESLSGGNKDGKSNYVIFNEADAQITDRVEFLRTADGVVYGWAVGGKIYLTKEGMNPNTPAHEYTHLWAQMVEKADPKLWGRIVDGLRGCATWNDVLNDKAYEGIWGDDSRMASEVLSRLTGAENYRREMARAQKEIADAKGVFDKAEKVSVWENVKKALRLFLDKVKKLMRFKSETSETTDVPAWMEFVDMALGDLYGGVNPGNRGGSAELMFIGERGAAAMDKAEEATTRLDNLAVAREMEAQGKDALAIKMATGWERGADGKWRYETEDVKLKKDFWKKKDVTLGDVADLGELAKAYPDLKDIKVVLDTNESEKRGAYNHKKNTITLYIMDANNARKIAGAISRNIPFTKFIADYMTSSAKKSVDKTLIHEIQHAIQHREGFAKGGNMRMRIGESEERLGYNGYRKLAGEVEARNVSERMGKTMDERRASLRTDTQDVADEDQIFIYEGLKSAMSSEENIDAVNARFNAELDGYINGNSKANMMFHVGNPMGVMQIFLPNLPIVMRPRVINKATNTKHDVSVEALHDLPKHISSPIFVFQRDDNALGVLTEIKDNNGKNVCVAIELNKIIQDGGSYLEVNDIRSIHGRDIENLILPIIHNNTLKYVDKEKGLDWLSSASSNYQQEITKQDLVSATKVVESFENPQILGQENDGDTLFSYKPFGGNSGYVGYSMSKRAAQARAEGRFPKTDFKKEYGVTERVLDALVESGIVDNAEWHHTSMYGNKTPFYGWVDDAYADVYAENKKVVKQIIEGKDADGSSFATLPAENPYTEMAVRIPEGWYPFVNSLDDSLTEDERDAALMERFGDAYAQMKVASENNRLYHEFEANKGRMERAQREEIGERLRGFFEERAATASQLTGRGDAATASQQTGQYGETATGLRDERGELRGERGEMGGERGADAVQRMGEGVPSDDAVSDANDLIGKALGKRRYGAKQRVAYAERVRRSMVRVADRLAKDLHLDNVDIVTDVNELPEGKKRGAKGFYSKSTGRITIVVPNHVSTYDIEQTVLHEAVAHYGLRKLFGAHFDTFLDNVFENAEGDVRRSILELAKKNGWDFRTATEEYLASLAEDTDFENAASSVHGWWVKLKRPYI